MLISLSRFPSGMTSENLHALLNIVTDLFLLDEDPSEGGRAFYGEIAIQALTALDAESRKEYAEQVAAAPTLPHAVAMKLAHDQEADVAGIVLKLSPVLTDIDLAAIAVSQSHGHLAAIAERGRLSCSVTDILVGCGDQTVLRIVSGNEGATFSDASFDRLLGRGKDDQAVGEALSMRSDLVPARAARVLQIVERFGDGQRPDAPSEHVANLAGQVRQQPPEVKIMIADIMARTREVDDVVVMLAEDDRACHLAQVIGTVSSLNVDHVLRVMMHRDPAGIAMVCRSLNMRQFAFRSILALRHRRLAPVEQDIEEIMLDYAQLDTPTAERALRFLKLKTSVV